LLAMLVLAHAVGLAGTIRRSLTTRLGDTVWFYVAASAALIAGIGLGVLMGGGAAGSADADIAIRLAHAHLNVLGWIGLAVIGTQLTLWPTVLHTRMVPGLRGASTAALLLTVAGLAVATAGLLGRHRGVAVLGLAGYTAGLTAALGPFCTHHMTQVVDGTLVKVMAWYDNEWGFTHQMVREAQRILGATPARS
jgi:nitrite reductase (NO-forming)